MSLLCVVFGGSVFHGAGPPSCTTEDLFFAILAFLELVP